MQGWVPGVCVIRLTSRGVRLIGPHPDRRAWISLFEEISWISVNGRSLSVEGSTSPERCREGWSS